MSETHIHSSLNREDTTFEVPLRPQTLDDFCGQEAICERLDLSISAAKQRGEPLGHCLLSGPPGLGKTTLANITAKAMGTNLIVTSGPAIDKAGDLAGVLTKLQIGDVLFIDEIHRLNITVEEYLYAAMEDFVLDLMIDTGPSARSVQVKLKPFTLVGATTRSGLLSDPFRSRFPFTYRLDFYPPEILTRVVLRSSELLGVSLDEEAALEIAKRSRGTPRVANNLIRWVRDFAQMRTENSVDKEVVVRALSMLEIDDRGLDELDRKMLTVMIEHYDGGPVGLNTLSLAVGEEANTLEEVHEPYLILQGFIKRTPRGREVTRRAYEHLNRSLPAKFTQRELSL